MYQTQVSSNFVVKYCSSNTIIHRFDNMKADELYCSKMIRFHSVFLLFTLNNTLNAYGIMVARILFIKISFGRYIFSPNKIYFHTERNSIDTLRTMYIFTLEIIKKPFFSINFALRDFSFQQIRNLRILSDVENVFKSEHKLVKLQQQ